MHEPPDYDDPYGGPPEGTVLVFRNGAGEPVIVPDEVATVAERAYAAYKERISGKTWAQIAEDHRYPSPTAARADVDAYMAEAKSLIVEATQKDMLTLEVARLDAMQFAVWSSALEGNALHLRAVLEIIKFRTHLLGIDTGEIGQQQGAASTLVVPHDEDGFIEAMKMASAEPSSQDEHDAVPSEHQPPHEE